MGDCGEPAAGLPLNARPGNRSVAAVAVAVVAAVIAAAKACSVTAQEPSGQNCCYRCAVQVSTE